MMCLMKRRTILFGAGGLAAMLGTAWFAWKSSSTRAPAANRAIGAQPASNAAVKADPAAFYEAPTERSYQTSLRDWKKAYIQETALQQPQPLQPKYGPSSEKEKPKRSHGTSSAFSMVTEWQRISSCRSSSRTPTFIDYILNQMSAQQ